MRRMTSPVVGSARVCLFASAEEGPSAWPVATIYLESMCQVHRRRIGRKRRAVVEVSAGSRSVNSILTSARILLPTGKRPEPTFSTHRM